MLIADRYRSMRRLGKGLSGDVYLVEDTETGRTLSLKYLRVDSPSHAATQMLDRFKEEFAILKELRHPHIARIADFGSAPDDHRYFFTEEFVDGPDLFAVTEGESPQIIEGRMVELLRALEFLHARQIFHFDLKPGNILIDSKNNAVKVIDFGLANLPGQEIAGTPSFMAPEVCLREPRDGRADLYAVGVLWYLCLTRSNPFKGQSLRETLDHQVHLDAPRPSAARGDLPAHVDPIIMRLLAKNPQHRYARPADVIRDLNYLGTCDYPVETEATGRGYLPAVGQLVGREAEWQRALALLQDDLHEPLLLIAGSSGLGKSRLCEEIRYAAQLQERACHILDHDQPLASFDHGALRLKIMHRRRKPGLTVVAAYVSDIDALQGWLPNEGVYRIDLTPFGEADIATYLRRVTGATDIPAPLIAAITQRTEGNPRLLEELLTACFARHTFFDAMGRWSTGAFVDLQSEAQQLPLPSSFDAWVASRLEGLSEVARQALQILSLCQRPVERQGLERLLGAHSGWLSPLIDAGWVVRQGALLTLKNPAVREWWCGHLSRGERVAWHDAIVRERASFPSEDLLYHQLCGSDPTVLSDLPVYIILQRSIEAWEGLAEILAWIWEGIAPTADHIRAVGIPRLEALIEKRDATAIVAWVDAMHAAVAKLPPSVQAPLLGILEEKNIEWLLRCHRCDEARTHIETLLSAAVPQVIAERIRWRNYLGRIAIERGTLEEAVAILEENWVEAEPLAPVERRRTMNNDLGTVYFMQGKYAEALAHFEDEARRLEGLGEAYLEARCRYNIGEALRMVDRPEEAVEHFLSAYTLAHRVGRHELTLRVLNGLGQLAMASGQEAAAIDYFERGLRLADRLGERSSAAAIATNLGILYHTRGDPAAAVSHLLHATHLLRRGERTAPDDRCLARALLELALLQQEEGADEAAAKSLQEAHEVASESGATTLMPYIKEAQGKELDMEHPKGVVRRPSSVVSDPWRQLLHINQQLARAKELPHLLQQILGHAVDLAGAECGLVLLIDAQGAFSTKALFNIEDDAALTEVSTSLARTAIQRKEVVLTDDAKADASWNEHESVMLGDLRSICCVPVHAAGKVIGCLYLSHRYQVGAFRNIDHELLTAFADQAGIAIDRTRDLEQAAHQVAELEESLAERDSEVSRLEAAIESSGGTRAYALESLRSNNAEMGKLFTLVRKVMRTDLTAFIHGETGTGKEVIARCLHTNHPERGKGPFVAVSCGAIPRELMESELFGYRAGAFTGANRDKAGLFETAHGGTLFFDEVAELPLALQAKLLRVLQEKELRRLGDTAMRKVECRVLSASHGDLKAAVKQGTFREDLYYRLCQIQLEIPPLRNRKEDVPMLVDEFTRRYAQEHRITGPIAVGRDVLRAFLGYAWPGNVRELENLVQTMCALAGGKALQLDDIPPHHPLAVEGAGLRSISEASSVSDTRSRSLAIQPHRGGEGGAPIGLGPLGGATQAPRMTNQPHRGGEGGAPIGLGPLGGATQAPIIDGKNLYDPVKSWREYEELITAKAYQQCDHDAKAAATNLGISVAKLYKVIKRLGLKDPQHPLYADPFVYLERLTLSDYLVKIFTAALLAVGSHPYQAIRNLQVSPGYFYKVVPSRRASVRH